jgi:hypothetical protein
MNVDLNIYSINTEHMAKSISLTYECFGDLKLCDQRKCKQRSDSHLLHMGRRGSQRKGIFEGS